MQTGQLRLPGHQQAQGIARWTVFWDLHGMHLQSGRKLARRDQLMLFMPVPTFLLQATAQAGALQA